MILSLAYCLGSATSTALSDSINISGVGDVVYPDLEIYDVTLPTAGSMDFLLDPLGLLSLEAGRSARIEELSGGLIVHPSDARIINNSSHSVKVSVSLRAESTDGGFKGGAVASFLGYLADDETTIASVEADGNVNNHILLYVVPSAVNLADRDAQFIPADTGYIITGDSVTLEFILPGALYSVATDSDGELITSQIPGTGSGIGLRIGGYVNTNADWSDFKAEHEPSTITVYATFTLTRADDSDPDGEDAPRAEGVPAMLVSDSAEALSVTDSGQ